MLTSTTATRKDMSSGLGPMQHRHFATVAAIVRGMDDADIRRHTAEHFARELLATNPNFDRGRFLRACGV